MKKLSVNSPEYRDIVSKLLGKEVKFENLPSIPVPTSPIQDKKKPFTGIRDVDLLILKELADEDLFTLCQVDKYINSLCNNENFWLNKLLKKYPDYKLLKMEATYKDIYKELFRLEKLKYDLKLKESIYNLRRIDPPLTFLNNLKEFPKYLTDLQTVEYINLSHNEISEIPDLNLPNLEYLNLQDNYIKILPTLNLPKLRELDLADNHISKIFEQNLPNLTKVNLHENRLKILPTLNFPKLELINVSYNKHLTAQIQDQNWPNLRAIDISRTQIKKKDLPTNIAKKVTLWSEVTD